MIFDVDGVLTDGTLYLNDRGEEMKAFNTRDGHGIKMLRESGVQIGILTARNSRVVERRASELGITLVRQGAGDKHAAFLEMLQAANCSAAEAGYMGDDLIDLPVLIRCGFAATVPEAPRAVRDRCHYVAHATGGRGAVREACEFVLQAQDRLEAALAAYIA
jgi:3-deoxy-D-manno-octulosonate 8-phosphate phosphatase (KDO 8-P phosphatase)